MRHYTARSKQGIVFFVPRYVYGINLIVLEFNCYAAWLLIVSFENGCSGRFGSRFDSHLETQSL